MDNPSIKQLTRGAAGETLGRFPERAGVIKESFSPELVAEWERLADLDTLAGLLAGTEHVRVIPSSIRRAGYGGGAIIQPKDARMFFECGLTVWFRGLDGIDLFRRLRHAWADELGISADSLYFQLFVSPPGVGTCRHFDVANVLAMQLKGRKEWTIAPYDTARDGIPNRESELLPNSEELPGQSTLVLERGDSLCLPRYWWHSTRALDESWSLSSFIEPRDGGT